MDDAKRTDGSSSGDPLIDRFRRGEPDAIARAAEQAREVMRLQGWRIPAEERADLIQDVMTETWQRMLGPGFATGRTFDAYVRSLAYWRCIDWRRRQRPTVPLDRQRSDPAPRPEEAVLRQERDRLGRRIIGQLGQPCRDLIHMHVGWDLTYRQIGEILGRSERALRVQMWACLKEARRLWERVREGQRATTPRGGPDDPR